MKKTVTLPDGTTEVLEGTPEEIAAHERLVRGESKKEKKKPDVLKGKEPDKSDYFELQKWLEELQKATKDSRGLDPYWPNRQGPIWVAPCSRCYSNPCCCNWIDLTPQIICRDVLHVTDDTLNGGAITISNTDPRYVTTTLTCSLPLDKGRGGNQVFEGYDGPGMF